VVTPKNPIVGSLLVFARAVSGHAAVAELVKFESAGQPLGSLQPRLAQERGEIPTDIPGDQIEGYLAKPEGRSPFPAIVVLHGCDGWHEAHKQMWADFLLSWGYVALLVDSFPSRGIDHACTPEKFVTAQIPKRPLDAFGALLLLADRSFVNPARIGVIGFSQGGGVALSVAEERLSEVFVNPARHEFRAAVAYYPPCAFAGGKPKLPTLILTGALDDWTPAVDCDRKIIRRGGAQPSVEFTIYPDAHHGFDAPTLQAGISASGIDLSTTPRRQKKQ
jgi:dienelactone hydrolase